MNKKITIRDKYGPAMNITDQAEADRYFEECVQHGMLSFDKTRHEAESLERINLGYFAGYYDRETRIRVEKLFRCAHPVFGSAESFIPSAEHAFNAGRRMATS